MQPVPQSQPGLREIDIGHYVRHYASLLWRWKWWILISSPLIAGIAFSLFLQFSNLVPVLTATALIGMEPIAGMIEDKEDQQTAESSIQTELIKSRNFLQNIVNSLSLRLDVSKVPRNTVFDSVFVDSSAQPDKFIFTIDKNSRENYTLFRKTGFLSKVKIAGGKLADLTSLTQLGVFVRFNRMFLQEPFGFKFSISPLRETVEALYTSLSIGTTNRSDRNPSFTISVKGKDAKLITTTVNTIAERYVEKNLSLRKARTRSVMEILEKQLSTAKEELEQSENRLRSFQSANPTTGLTQNMIESVNELNEIEHGAVATEADLADARTLQLKLINAPAKDAAEAAREVLLFLNAKGNTSTPVLDAEITRLLGEQQDLQEKYDADHPKYVQNLTAINAIIAKTNVEISSFIRTGESRQSERKTTATALSDKMRTLPAKELELAKLMRQQQVNNDIYSRILDKYNQSKVSDVVEVSDVYVMDHAVVPIPPPEDPIKLMGICLALCLVVVFGPMMLFDLLAKSVRTEQELKTMLPFDILESIPSISRKRKKGKSVATDGKKTKPLDGILIVNEFKSSQEYIKELFRSLRTKILLSLQLVPDKSLVITSLDAGAGKSTITANIAIALAQQNRKTIIIDGDLRLGTMHKLFKIEKSPGLSEFLASELPVSDECVMPILRQTAIPNLSIIPSGRYAVNAGELISSDRFSKLKQLLSDKFESVLCDSPPIGVTADAVAISNTFARYIIVIRAGKTNVVDLKKKLREYPALSSKLLGVVLNCAATDSKLKYYKYSKYY